jgi:hypothetical protein
VEDGDFIVMHPIDAPRYVPLNPAGTPGKTPVGWSEWAWPSKSCDQLRSELLALPAAAMINRLNQVVPTFEFAMFLQHVRPLRWIELLGISDDHFQRHFAVAIMKSNLASADGKAHLFVQGSTMGIGRQIVSWELVVWPEASSIRQSIVLRPIPEDRKVRLSEDIISTYRMKVAPDATEVEVRSLLTEAMRDYGEGHDSEEEQR